MPFRGCTSKSVKDAPNGAFLYYWAHLVCACDQHGLSETCHVNLYVADDSSAAYAERGTVGTLIDFALARLTIASDQYSLCDVDGLPACRSDKQAYCACCC